MDPIFEPWANVLIRGQTFKGSPREGESYFSLKNNQGKNGNEHSEPSSPGFVFFLPRWETVRVLDFENWQFSYVDLSEAWRIRTKATSCQPRPDDHEIFFFLCGAKTTMMWDTNKQTESNCDNTQNSRASVRRREIRTPEIDPECHIRMWLTMGKSPRRQPTWDFKTIYN